MILEILKPYIHAPKIAELMSRTTTPDKSWLRDLETILSKTNPKEDPSILFAFRIRVNRLTSDQLVKRRYHLSILSPNATPRAQTILMGMIEIIHRRQEALKNSQQK